MSKTYKYTVNTQRFVFWSNGYMFRPLIRAVIRPYHNMRVEKLSRILLYKRNHIAIYKCTHHACVKSFYVVKNACYVLKVCYI